MIRCCKEGVLKDVKLELGYSPEGGTTLVSLLVHGLSIFRCSETCLNSENLESSWTRALF